MAEVLGRHNLKTIVRLRTIRRITATALVVTTQLGSTRPAIGAVPGLTTAVTVSIDGTTGWWMRTAPSTEVPGGPVTTDPATASAAPSPDQSIVPTPAVPQTITRPSTSTPPVDEPPIINESEPTIPS